MEHILNRSPKRPVNLKAKAEALGSNLSATVEIAMETAAKAARTAQWQVENREMFAAYDKRIERNGVFSAGKRQF